MIIRVSTDLVQPWPFKVVIDNVLRDRPLHLHYFPHVATWLESLGRWNLLWCCAAFMLVRTILDGIFTYLSSMRMTAISEHVTFDIRRALFNHVQRLSLGFFDRNRTGDLVTRFTGDSSNIEDMLVAVVSVSLVNGLTIAATVLIMFGIDWQLTLIAFTVLPLLFVVNRFFTKRIRAASRERRRTEGEIASLVQEDLSLIRTIQAFCREVYESDRFKLHSAAARDAGLRSTRLQSQFSPLSTFITGLGTTLVIVLGARSVLLGRISLGTLIVLLTYLRSLYNPVKQLSRLVNIVTKATVSAERVAEVLDAAPEVCDSPRAINIPPLLGNVRFEDVSFAYPTRTSEARGASVLNAISLNIPAGATIALLGHTGAGKTTLVNLIPRFHDPVQGRVLIDGHDIRDLRLADLRRQISIVPQEAPLFRASVWENIAYGSTRAAEAGAPVAASIRSVQSMDEVQSAAIAANAHEFICRLPDRYDTIVGERGNTLSGGQRQRIAIARAMIRSSPILILDEPTTGLDVESEALVMQAIERMKAGRTTIVIAHRLTTIRSADLIVVLERGHIDQVGTHDELYETNALYRSFFDRQFQMGLAET